MPQPWFSHQVRKKFLISHIHSAFAAFAAVPSVKLPVGLEETIMARDFDAGSCLARFGLDWTKAKVMAYGKRELPLHTHRFLQLQKNGRLAGYNFIGWLKKTGELVKDACPQSPHTPIYWKMPETGKWFCFSQTALLKAVVNDAILSVDDWKRLVQNFSPRWHFMGFVHGASGHCIVDVAPPINAETKVRLHTDEDHNVFTCFLKNTLAKQQ